MPELAMWIPTAITALICLQAGLLLLVILQDDGPRLTWPETLATGFGLGVGALTFELMLMGLASIPFRLSLVLVPWPIAWTIAAFTTRRRRPRPEPRAPRPASSGEDAIVAILFCLLAGLVALVFVHAALFPLEDWDEWLIWDLKARAFWLHEAIKPFLTDRDYIGTHFDYPLLTPLAGTLLYLVAGAPLPIVQIIPATFFLCSLTQFAAGMRRFGASTLWTVASAFALACLPPLLYSAQVFLADGPTVYYVLTSTIFLALYLRDERPMFLRLAAASAGFATQVRAEAVLLLIGPLALLLLRAIVTRAWSAFTHYAAIVAALFLPWAIAARFITAPEGRELDRAGVLLLHRLDQLPGALGTIGHWMLSPDHLGPFILLLPLVLILCVAHWRRIVGNWSSAVLLIAAIWAVTPYVAFITARPEANFLDAMGRYLVVSSVLTFLFVNVELITTTARAQRLALAIGGVSLTLWMGADAIGWIAPPQFFHRLPIESARAVLTQAETLATLTPVQRIQRMEQKGQRMGFAGMLPALINEPLPAGDVILFTSPKTADAPAGSYVHGRLMYLLYPHHVRVIDDEAALARALAASPAALVVYAARPPLDRVAGAVTFRFGDRYAVIRAPRLTP
jgi:hypothetical protein